MDRAADVVQYKKADAKWGARLLDGYPDDDTAVIVREVIVGTKPKRRPCR